MDTPSTGQGQVTRPRPSERSLLPGAGRLQPDPLAQTRAGAVMSVRGRWHVVKIPGYDMAPPGAYILFDQDGGEFAFDCLTGSIHGACDGNAVEFTWDGNDEMEEANGHGWAELQNDGSLKGQIRLKCGDDIPFIARRRKPFQRPASSAAPTMPTADNWPENLLRHVASRYLRERYGIEVAPTTLAKWFCTRSDGPPAFIFGRRPMYPKAELDIWAVRRLGRLRKSTSDTQTPLGEASSCGAHIGQQLALQSTSAAARPIRTAPVQKRNAISPRRYPP